MKKVFLTLALIVIVAAGAAWYFATYRLDSVLESRIERAATLAMGTRVEVGGVSADIRGGALRIDHISVANPPGFENPHAVKFNGVEAAVDYDSLEIRRIVIDHPEFVIEERDGETNFGQMLKEIEQQAPPTDSSSRPEPEIVIRHFRINETRAVVESHSFDRYTDVGVEAIELNDLRGTPSELARVIAREVIGELSSEAAAAMLDAEARKRLGDMKDEVKIRLRGLMGRDPEPDDTGGE